VWTLLIVAASPLPQTPALIFTAVSRLPPAEVFLALFIGKSLKYGVYAWLAATFPDYFHRIVAALLPAEAQSLAIGSCTTKEHAHDVRPL
jgi:hypothetical protein